MSRVEIKIEPFIGEEYGKTDIFGGKKILALGESLYINEEDDANGKFKELTKELVKQYIHFRKNNGEFKDAKYIGGWTNTYLKFERALIGKETNSEDSENIWNSIVFYNYLQTPITEGARASGSNQAYADSQDAFIEVVKEHEPDLIVVWGVGILYDALPPSRDNFEWNERKDIFVDNYKVNCGSYTWIGDDKERHTANVVAIYHPSSGFSWQWWHDNVIANEYVLTGKTTCKDQTNKDMQIIPQDINKRIADLTNEIAEKEECLNRLLHLKKSQSTEI